MTYVVDHVPYFDSYKSSNLAPHVCLLSGGFDPVHVGHVRMFKQAKEEYDFVFVLLNSDAWLVRKKGRAFMPFEERQEVLRAMRYVDDVVAVDDSDGSVAAGIEKFLTTWPLQTYFTFGNGGDRLQHNTPETLVCKAYDVRLRWNLGGGKIQSSSELIKNASTTK